MMGIFCHNITMEAFAAELKGIAGGGYVTNAVVDSTGLKGSWDFDIEFTNKALLLMKIHYEDQPVTAYTLVAAKPKLKKADPSTRTGCKLGNGPNAANTGSFVLPARMVTCQNMTMAQFAYQLQSIAGPYVHYPVLDATGLDGGWDLSFAFSPIPANQLAGLRWRPTGRSARGSGGIRPGRRNLAFRGSR
jgi:hypothetical protein